MTVLPRSAALQHVATHRTAIEMQALSEPLNLTTRRIESFDPLPHVHVC
jgi:hypothetical protein